jgi:hypothetical protein
MNYFATRARNCVAIVVMLQRTRLDFRNASLLWSVLQRGDVPAKKRSSFFKRRSKRLLCAVIYPAACDDNGKVFWWKESVVREAQAASVQVGSLGLKNKSLLLLFFRKEDPSFLKERSKELLMMTVVGPRRCIRTQGPGSRFAF